MMPGAFEFERHHEAAHASAGDDDLLRALCLLKLGGNNGMAALVLRTRENAPRVSLILFCKPTSRCGLLSTAALHLCGVLSAQWL